MALLSARAPDVVLAEAGAWPSAPRVVLQGYLLNEAPRMAFEAWLRPKRLARRRRLLRFFAIYAETSPLTGFLFGVDAPSDQGSTADGLEPRPTGSGKKALPPSPFTHTTVC